MAFLLFKTRLSKHRATPQAEAAQAAEEAQTAREEADSTRVAAAAAEAQAGADLSRRQRAHDRQVDDLSQQLQQLRYVRECTNGRPFYERFAACCSFAQGDLVLPAECKVVTTFVMETCSSSRPRRWERELVAKELSAAKEAATEEATALREELQAAANDGAEQLQQACADAALVAATLSAENEAARVKLRADAAAAEAALSAELEASRRQLQDGIAAAGVLAEDAARRVAQIAEAQEALAGAESQLEDMAANSARLAAELEAVRGELRDRGAAEGSSAELQASQEVIAQQARWPVTSSLTSNKLMTMLGASCLNQLSCMTALAGKRGTAQMACHPPAKVAKSADVQQAAELEALHARVAADASNAEVLRFAQQDAMEHQACLCTLPHVAARP